ncbi:MAG: SDR family NAD(P)-dependent oxidoreductase [Elusimicrobiota bacterium]|jgi:NAD(P)-dependent dehydrogenase (short-subunit alcohol dehydrogenase family)
MPTIPERIVLVTGANKGIGFEACRQLLPKGLFVLLGSRNAGRGAEAVKALGSPENLELLVIDVASPGSVAAAAKAVEERFGRLDILLNNAGGNYDMHQTASQADFSYIMETLEMNFLGTWRVIQAFLPLLRKGTCPRIVNVSSTAGSFGDPRYGLTTGEGRVTAYGSAKAALNALTVKLAAELKKEGIPVNAVCPGFTATHPGMKEMGARPVEEGTAGITWLSLLEGKEPTGKFFRDEKEIPW